MQIRKPMIHSAAAALATLLACTSVYAADNTGPLLPPQSGDSTAPASSAGSYVDDALITTKVKAALIEDKQVSGLKINVTTQQGIVKMTGTVPSSDVGQRAVELASRVDGVKTVQSDLKVKASS